MLNEVAISRIARELGVEGDSLAACSDEIEIQTRIWSDRFLSSRLGVRRVPTLFVNGIEVQGEFAVEDLRDLIEFHSPSQRN